MIRINDTTGKFVDKYHCMHICSKIDTLFRLLGLKSEFNNINEGYFSELVEL